MKERIEANKKSDEIGEGYRPIPQPDEIPEREREDAMGGYLMMFAAVAIALPLPVINLIAAVTYYYANRRKSSFIHFHALQSLLSQIPTTLLNWGLLAWIVRIFLLDLNEPNKYFYGFIIFVVIVNLIYFVFSLIAAYYARKGRMYYFIFFGKISFQNVFSKTRNFQYVGDEPINEVNRPPSI